MSINVPKQPYGITIPIQHGSGGYFDQCYYVPDQLKYNLTNLLLTIKGERRMNPDFGSSLHSVVFEFDNEDLPSAIDGIIRRDVQTWMPYLTIESVTTDIRSDLRDIYTIHITVKFTVDSLGITEAQTVDFSIEKTQT